MMMEKRNIQANNIGETGWLICKSGRFSLYVMSTGLFKLVDSVSNVEITDLTAEDVDGMAQLIGVVPDWISGHNVVL